MSFEDKTNKYVTVAELWQAHLLKLTVLPLFRPLIKSRVTMKRREFGNENSGQFIDKEPGEQTYDLKTYQKAGA